MNDLRDKLNALPPCHTERIRCPACLTEQDATVEHTQPFPTYIHNCACGYTIMESEWDRIDGEYMV